MKELCTDPKLTTGKKTFKLRYQPAVHLLVSAYRWYPVDKQQVELNCRKKKYTNSHSKHDTTQAVLHTHEVKYMEKYKQKICTSSAIWIKSQKQPATVINCIRNMEVINTRTKKPLFHKVNYLKVAY